VTALAEVGIRSRHLVRGARINERGCKGLTPSLAGWHATLLQRSSGALIVPQSVKRLKPPS